MDKAIFHLKRDHYRGDTTLGNLFDPCNDHFCYVLEDVVRGFGIKDKGNTAIPATADDMTYFMRIRESPKYGKVVVIFTENPSPDYYELRNGGIMFSQILAHGGNDAEDTEGCILVNRNRDVSKMNAWGSMKEEIAAEVERLTDEGYDVRLRVTNMPQES